MLCSHLNSGIKLVRFNLLQSCTTTRSFFSHHCFQVMIPLINDQNIGFCPTQKMMCNGNTIYLCMRYENHTTSEFLFIILFVALFNLQKHLHTVQNHSKLLRWKEQNKKMKEYPKILSKLKLKEYKVKSWTNKYVGQFQNMIPTLILWLITDYSVLIKDRSTTHGTGSP